MAHAHKPAVAETHFCRRRRDCSAIALSQRRRYNTFQHASFAAEGIDQGVDRWSDILHDSSSTNLRSAKGEQPVAAAEQAQQTPLLIDSGGRINNSRRTLARASQLGGGSVPTQDLSVG